MPIQLITTNTDYSKPQTLCTRLTHAFNSPPGNKVMVIASQTFTINASVEKNVLEILCKKTYSEYLTFFGWFMKV